MKKLFFSFIWLIIFVGITIHFTIKDYVLFTAVIFYALPLPILIFLTLFLAVFTKKNSRKVSIVTGLLLIFIWVNKSYVSNTIDDKVEGFEIVFWNASRHNKFNEAFKINSSIPDVMVMVESGNSIMKNVKKEYPHYYFYLSKKEIAIFSKTPIKIIKETTSKNNSNLINFETNNLNFYAVDIQGHLGAPRKLEIKFINELINENKKTIILGDFNTPIESRYFQFFNDNFVNAFKAKGNGFRETWFWNIPLLSLDHIWVSKDLQILQTEKINTFKSDHSMLRMSLKN